MIHWIGYALWIVGLCGLIVLVRTSWKWFWFGIAVIGIFGYSLGAELTREEKILRNFTKEVNLQQVAVKGSNSFRAQVQIVYEDGKLKYVALVPNTTVISEVVNTEKK